MQALAFLGLVAFVVSSPAFPLAPRLLDAVVPGVNMSVFTVAAGVASIACAVAVILLYVRRGGLGARMPGIALGGCALYASSFFLTFAVIPFFARTDVAVAFGALFGVGLCGVFLAWGAAIARVLPDARSFGFVLGSASLAVLCAVAAGVGLHQASRAAIIGAVVVAGVLSAGVPAALIAMGLRGNRDDGSADDGDKATMSEFIAMWPGVAAWAAGVDDGDGDGSQDGGVGHMVTQVLLPIAILLLYAASQLIAHSIEGHYEYVDVSALVACVLAFAPLVVRDDSRRMAFSLRVLLPLLGVMVLGISLLVDDAHEAGIASLGAQALCFAYAIVLLAVTVYFALVRMRSALPLMLCVWNAALALVMVLPHFTLRFEGAAMPLFLALLVLSLCMLVATPSISAWGESFAVAHAAGAQGTDEKTLADKVKDACDAVANAYGLSPREREVLGYLGRGYGPRYLATVLPIKENTIRSHVRNIYAKTDVHTQADLLVLIDSFAEEE